MKPVVIDASAAIAWLLPRQRTTAAARFLKASGGTDHDWRAPFVFGWEVDNALIRLLRNGQLSAEAYDDARAQLDRFEIKLGAPFDSDAVAPMALAAGLSLFDAAYLDHALENGCELASRDHDLLAAASRRGVTVHDLSAEAEA